MDATLMRIRYLARRWRRLNRISQLCKTEGIDASFIVQFKEDIGWEIYNLLRKHPVWEVFEPYNYIDHKKYALLAAQIIAFIPENISSFTTKKWQQYCGFGAPFYAKRNYNRKMKRAVINFIIASTFPTKLPPAHPIGEQCRNEFKRLRQKRTDDDIRHVSRLAIINTARSFVNQIRNKILSCTQTAAPTTSQAHGA